MSAAEKHLTAKLDTDLSVMEKRLTVKMDTDLSAMEGRLTAKLNDSVSAVEKRLTAKLDTDLFAMEGRLQAKLDTMESQLNSRITWLRCLIIADRDNLAKLQTDFEGGMKLQTVLNDRLERRLCELVEQVYVLLSCYGGSYANVVHYRGERAFLRSYNSYAHSNGTALRPLPHLRSIPPPCGTLPINTTTT